MTVYVCAERDHECPDHERNACLSCPKFGAVVWRDPAPHAAQAFVPSVARTVAIGVIAWPYLTKGGGKTFAERKAERKEDTMSEDIVARLREGGDICCVKPEDAKVPRALLMEAAEEIERLQHAMRYVREHERDVFWMTHNLTDDFKFRTALASVALNGSDEDRDIITRSVQPLKMLNAAMQGIPVDFGAMQMDEDMLPLMKIWHETAEGDKG